MNKKIGIITHYHKSINYGGVLQSYALCRFINSNGVCSEQIQFNIDSCYKNRFKLFLIKIYNAAHLLFQVKSLRKMHSKRHKFYAFRKIIPHSKKVYSIHNIAKSNKKYDLFIVGSDQVWNPNVLNEAYLLNFTNKDKYSYAASIATETISASDYIAFQASLSKYKGVSVRERNSIKLLDGMNNVFLSADPVFLLSENDWNSIIPRTKWRKKYVFCYFLGGDKPISEILNYAKKNDYDIIDLSPMQSVTNNGSIFSFFDSGPLDFLNFLKNSQIVFTDSFHAICFSYIFKKEFFAFKRQSSLDMGTRITDILETLKLSDRLIDYSQVKELHNYTPTSYKNNEIINDLINSSKKYLQSIICSLNNMEKSDENN